MKSLAQKFVIWTSSLALVALVICFVVLRNLLYSPVAKDTPLMKEVAGMHEICTKLVYYAEQLHALPSTDAGKTVDSLVSAGILSEEDGMFIRDHHIQFRGFDPTDISPDVVVLESVFTNTRTPRRVIGYADGHVVTQSSE